ncbi:hypothetical protein GCM10022396_00040 [Flavivirga amylovorans]
MKYNKTYIPLLICTLGSIGFIALLFISSEKKIHRDNSFTRRLSGHPAIQAKKLDLKYNSYYIAGADNGQIYLGNTTAPLRLTVLDTALQNKKEISLSVDQDSLPFHAIRLRVVPPYFFLTDGVIPYIYRGNTTDWIASSIMDGPAYFSKIEPIDSTNFIIKATSNKTKESVLGKINLVDSLKVDLSYELLQKQIDGVFDTDGSLLYNRQLQKLVYTYFYRNQYIVADKNLELKRLGKTIDTISRAQIKVGTIASKNQLKMAAPALLVNKYSATYGSYLFVNSKLIGRYEPIDMWEQASIIDVYNIEENTYEFSFYVYNIGKDKLKTFQVLNDKLIAMIGNHIVIYQLSTYRFNKLEPALKETIDQKITYSQIK